MSEWWADLLTYRPSDFLMFSPRIYWRLFESLNQSVWPAPLLGVAAALIWLLCSARCDRGVAPRASALVLGLCWLWVAWLFLWLRYAPINWAAEAFAVGFVLQGLGLWASAAFSQPRASPPPLRRRVGLGLLLWALLGHPLLAALDGRPWSQAEVFGLAPDPTAIGTLGWLLWLGGRPALWAVPLLWCAISAATLATMGSALALVPLAAALLAVAAARWR
jgi:Family of unknown function (DUF6064)